MGSVLLDDNVLVALAWPAHEAHQRVGKWFARHNRSGWATCPFTESGLVRVLSNPAFSADALTPANALAVLGSNLSLSGHEFWPADIGLIDALRSVGRGLSGHRQLTDAYLLGLAIRHRGRFATLDRGVGALDPGGFVETVG